MFKLQKPKPVYLLVHTCGRVHDTFNDGTTYYWYNQEDVQRVADEYHRRNPSPEKSLRIIKYMPLV